MCVLHRCCVNQWGCNSLARASTQYVVVICSSLKTEVQSKKVMEFRLRAKLPNCSTFVQPNQMAGHITFASGDLSDCRKFLKLAISLTHASFCTRGFSFATKSLVTLVSTDVIELVISLTLYFSSVALTLIDVELFFFGLGWGILCFWAGADYSVWDEQSQ